MDRARVLAVMLGVAGGGLVIAGAFAEGYAQAVSVEVGAAVLLLIPFVLVERYFSRMVDQRVEDGVARALREGAPVPPGDRPDDVIRDISQVIRDVAAVRCERGGLEFIVEGGLVPVGVAIHENRYPMDRATLERLSITATRAGAASLLVVLHSPLTHLAQRWVAQHPSVRVAMWEGAESASSVIDALRTLLQPKQSTRHS